MNWLLILLCVFFLIMLSGNADAADTVTAVTTLNDSLVAIIQQVQTGVSAGVSFLSDEIPDVIRQLIIFKMAYTGFLCVIGVLLFIPGVVYWSKLIFAKPTLNPKYDTHGTSVYKYLQDYWFEFSDSVSRTDASITIGLLPIGIPMLIGVGLVAANFGDLLKLWIAPKVWLIEYAASLVK